MDDLDEIPEVTREMFAGGVRNKYRGKLAGPGRPALAAGYSGKAPVTSVRFTPDLLARLRMAALEEGVTVGDIIRRAVEHELAPR